MMAYTQFPSFDEVSRALFAARSSWLPRVFPSGHVKGRSFIINTAVSGLDPRFDIPLSKPIVRDFRGDFAGDDLSLYARATGQTRIEAAKDAAEWLGLSGGHSFSPTRRPQAPLHEPEISQAIDADKLLHARAQWDAGVTIKGTIAETYLSIHRLGGAVLPAFAYDTGLVRFNHAYRSSSTSFAGPALIFKATDIFGRFQAIQAIRLSSSGEKFAGKGAKITNGYLRGAAVRFPGDGDLILAEGPEKALAVAIATGRPVWVALGSVKNIVGQILEGSKVTVCRDNDAPDSQARAIFNAAANWLAKDNNCNVLIAAPTHITGLKKTDFDDIYFANGADEVAKQINQALPWYHETLDLPPGLTPAMAFYEPATLTAAEGQELLSITICNFLDAFEISAKFDQHITAGLCSVPTDAQAQAEATIFRAQAQAGDDDTAVIAAALRFAGVKSREIGSIDALMIRLNKLFDMRLRRQLRPGLIEQAEKLFGKKPDLARLQIKASAGLGKTSLLCQELSRRPWLLANTHIDFCVPTHALANSIINQIPGARMIAGRDKMNCDRSSIANEIAQNGQSAFKALCKHCPLFSSCAWVAQHNNKSFGARVFAHNFITLPKILGMPKADLTIIDETIISKVEGHYEFSPDRIRSSTASRSIGYSEVAYAVSDAITHKNYELKRLRELGITSKMLGDAARYLDHDEEDLRLHYEMSDSEIREKLSIIAAAETRKLSKLFRTLSAEIDLSRNMAHCVEYCANAQVVVKVDGRFQQECQERVFVHWLRKIYIPTDTALLLIDADANLALNQRVFGDNLRETEICVKKNSFTIQVYSNSFSKFSLSCGSERAQQTLDQIKIVLSKEAAGQKKVLVVTNKDARCKLTGEDILSPLPLFAFCCGCFISHFGNIRGIDDFKDFDTVILIGRNQPSLLSVERTARAIFATDPEPLLLLASGDAGDQSAWAKQSRGYLTSSVKKMGVEVDTHPDTRAQMILELMRECESVQAIDRLRLIHRQIAGRVLILCALPLPVPVDEIKTWAELHTAGQPTIFDALLASESGAIVAAPYAAMSEAHPGIFRSAEHARGLMRRLNSGGTALKTLMQFHPDMLIAQYTVSRADQRAVTITILHLPGVDPDALAHKHWPNAIRIDEARETLAPLAEAIDIVSETAPPRPAPTRQPGPLTIYEAAMIRAQDGIYIPVAAPPGGWRKADSSQASEATRH